MSPPASEECMQGVNHHLPVAFSVLLSPEHDVIDLRVVTFQKHVSRAQRHKHTVLVQRQDPLSLHRKHSVSVTAVCCVVEEHQIGDTVVGLVFPAFLEVTEYLLIHSIKDGV